MSFFLSAHSCIHTTALRVIGQVQVSGHKAPRHVSIHFPNSLWSHRIRSHARGPRQKDQNTSEQTGAFTALEHPRLILGHSGARNEDLNDVVDRRSANGAA
eukprot:scaffold130810_cov32-Tisochrysis_lutea.AAC.1